MNEKYIRRKAIRRETDKPGLIYRTLLRSYLWNPPVWVYILELVAVGAILALLIVYDKETLGVLFDHLKGRP